MKNVEIKFEERRAICTLDKGASFDTEKAIAALDDEGFEKSTVAK